MEVLTRVRAAGRTIDLGVATTEAELAAILAQRFRVYRRRGYYRPGVTLDRDEYMVGSAGFVPGEARAGFEFPYRRAPERFLRAPASAGVRLHEIAGGRPVYPADGPAAPCFYRHPDPVGPVYWLVDELAPAAEQAISAYGSRYTAAARERDIPTSVAPMS